VLDPLAQIGENATQLMAALPPHSHHRAPLLHALSDGLPSSAVAPLLHASPSYIRDCKRKNYDSSDLFTQKYQPGTHRARLSADIYAAVFNFLAEACAPITSHGAYKQFVKDDDLFQEYLDSRPEGPTRTHFAGRGGSPSKFARGF